MMSSPISPSSSKEPSAHPFSANTAPPLNPLPVPSHSAPHATTIANTSHIDSRPSSSPSHCSNLAMSPPLYTLQPNPHCVLSGASHATAATTTPTSGPQEPSRSWPISSSLASPHRTLHPVSKMTAHSLPFTGRAKDEINIATSEGGGGGSGSGGLATSFQSLAGFPTSPMSSLSSSSSLPASAIDESSSSSSGKFLFGSAQSQCHPSYLGPSMPAIMGALPKKISLYKTEFCRTFEETGFCRYGVKCQFAHDKNELRVVPRHPRYKTEICRTFWELGNCPYGKRCCFIHLEAGALLNGAPPGQGSNLNEANLPFPLSRPTHSAGPIHQGPSSPPIQSDNPVATSIPTAPLPASAPTLTFSEKGSLDQTLLMRRDLPRFTEEFPSLQPLREGRHVKCSSGSRIELKPDVTTKENQTHNLTHMAMNAHFQSSRSNSLCHETAYSIVQKAAPAAHQNMNHVTSSMSTLSLDPSPDWTPMTSFYPHFCRNEPVDDPFLQERLPATFQGSPMPRHVKRSCSISLPASAALMPAFLAEPFSGHASEKVTPISRPLALGLDSAQAGDSQWLWSYQTDASIESKQMAPYASIL